MASELDEILVRSLGMLVANILEEVLRTESCVVQQSNHEDSQHAFKDSRIAQEQDGVHIHSSIDNEPGAPQSGEHRASICAAREGITTGMDLKLDPDHGWRSRAFRRLKQRAQGLQDTGGRSVNEK